MIFAIGFGLFVLAVLMTWANRPQKAGFLLSLMGLGGLLAMLVSVCILISRFMP